ncbi:MAG: HNH endonuclease [Candidatus Anammoxibacter sp.]
MSEWIHIDKDPKHVAGEKAKARALKKTQWWLDRVNRRTCYYCEKIYNADEITMDHVVPMARGGKSTRGNIVPCCKGCNSEKKYLTPAEIVLNKLRNGVL